MNRSFGKALAVATIALMISSAASAQALQGQWGADGCFYATVVNQLIPAGLPGHFQQYRAACNVRDAAGRLYQIAADGRQYLWTAAGWLEVRAAASGTQKAGQEQSTGNPQATSMTQQTLGQQQIAEFFGKRSRDDQEKYERSVSNSILPCSGEKNYWDCVEKDRLRKGYACYSSRDRSTNHCQQEAVARAAAAHKQQELLDARAAEAHRLENARRKW